MLAYVYDNLSFSEYQSIDTEPFDSVTALYSQILLLGLPVLIRGGLVRSYQQVMDPLSAIRGKFDISSSIKKNALVNKKLIVLYDEFSENNVANQIIKKTLLNLTTAPEIQASQKQKIFSLIPYFSEVATIELSVNTWNQMHINKQNKRYKFILEICRLLFEEQLIISGNHHINDSINHEKKMYHLYERFLFAFYQRETNYTVCRPIIKWNVDDGYSEALPEMKTDIVLQNKDRTRTLIIDAKFYSKSMTSQYGQSILKHHSPNLYQLFTYVSNYCQKRY